ncbi:uncharacterized protein [Haliotis cracherodii]|uniref:uncharacterized protein n=1 Tax=Haliotis cracherodii TaxID=6455 RepID=UPI0039E8178A
MKERVYGWYPSANDVYARGPYNKYQQECLYKFRDTMYESKPLVPPSPTLMVRGYSPAPPTGMRSASASQSQANTSTAGPRAKSAPIPKFKLIPRLHIPTPSQCWSTNLPETDYTVAPPTQNPLEGSRPSTASTQVSWPVPKTTKPEVHHTTNVPVDHSDRSQISWPRPKSNPEPAETPDMMMKRTRIKSASLHREKTPIPTRPVKSAGPVRSPMPPRSTTPAPEPRLSSPPKPKTPVLRPKTPAQDPDSADEGVEAEEWEVAREKYGWMAEVHGNPYGYKKIAKRLPYTVKCVEPELAPEPPVTYMENMETFFFNTIPRRPMTFAVHKEWISEVLHAKRLELQKREGVKYRWKNFGFVY